MIRRLVLWLVAVKIVTVVSCEVLLGPAPSDRARLYAIMAVPALVSAALAPLLSKWVSRRATAAGVALAVALSSLTLAISTSTAATKAMFVSSHDFRLFLVVLIMSSGVALAMGVHLARPFTDDLGRVADVAGQVASGNLNVRTGLDRPGEIGAVAREFDRMVESLQAADEERTRVTDARRYLFTSLGHDLRTPLAALQAVVESLQDGVADDVPAALATMERHVHAIEELLDQLIEYSRLESGAAKLAPVPVSLAELVDDCVDAMRPLALKRNIELVAHPAGPAVVLASPAELSRVLRNLVDNAVRHGPVGSTVELSVHDHGDSVRLEVLDHGDGFPTEFRAQAFEPFRKADPERGLRSGHIGLGLAICKAIVEAHGGRIWLGQPPGGRVHLTLPRPAASV